MIEEFEVPEIKTLSAIVEELCDPDSFLKVYHRAAHDSPMPSVNDLRQIVEMLRGVLFPGFFGHNEITPETMRYSIGSSLDGVFRLLRDQVRRGFCFFCRNERATACEDCENRSREITLRFLSTLPRMREILATDVQAAFDGDPAARSPGETIFCYPSIRAMTNYRIAHELKELGVDLIPRIITEMAHSETGIDINPGARIGESFFMDHGTGIVIGETCIIGRHVRIYQGVTLGAKSFPKDERNRLVKGLPRHPIVEDDVTIYAGATILGRITIGRGAVIGGNVWITEDVPTEARITQSRQRSG
jgi:serine O-acetyltransferase